MWAAGISFSVAGARMGVRLSTAAALDHVRKAVPRGARLRRDPRVDHLYSLIVGGPRQWRGCRDYHLLYEGGFRVCRTFNLDDVVLELENRIAFRLAIHGPQRTPLQGCALVWRRKALLVVGSASASSWLVERLREAGARPFASRRVVIDTHGRIRQWARAFRGRNGEGQRVEEPYGSLGERAAEKGVRLSAIAVVDGLDRPKVLTPGLGVLALLRTAAASRVLPASAVTVISAALRRVPLVRLPEQPDETGLRLLLDTGR